MKSASSRRGPGGRLMAAVVMGATLMACEPVWHVHTRVIAAPPCAASASSATAAAATPIEKAQISLQCDASKPTRLGETDAQGRSTLSQVGFLPRCTDGRCPENPTLSRSAEDPAASCLLLVEKEGYASQAYPLDQFCQAYSGTRCFRVALTVSLSPARSLMTTPTPP